MFEHEHKGNYFRERYTKNVKFWVLPLNVTGELLIAIERSKGVIYLTIGLIMWVILQIVSRGIILPNTPH